MSVKLITNTDPNGLGINSNHEALVALNTDASNAPERVGAVKVYYENDDGAISGTPYLESPEVDDDYRLRTASDIMLDNETFNYAAQNTGKHTYTNTTMTFVWGTNGITTNGGNVTTTTIGATFGTYAEFPIFSSNSLYAEFSAGFSNQPVANSVIDFGLFRRGGSNPFAPTDGVYFRMNVDGLQGVINYNGSEVAVTFNQPFTYIVQKKYQFIITVTEREVEFWIDNQLYAIKDTPVGNGQPFMSSTLPLSVRHAHIGTAGGIMNFILNDYALSLGGSMVVRSLGELGNAIFGSYQGISGGTMGALNNAVLASTSTNPTAAVPLYASLAANLCGSLGGRSWETFTSGLALNVDGYLQLYQVPAGTVSILGKRLKITGIKLSAYVQTVIVGAPFNSEFMLVYGHTAATMATAEGANTKKPRLVMLPELTQTVTAAQAVSTTVAQPGGCVSMFPEPIYVNPGEYVGLVIKHVGTIATAGVIAYNIQYIYSWE